jgi:hypothetical protein
MKNKIISTIVALSVVGTSYAIEVNDNLSINGFVDTSYSNAKTDGSATNTEKVSIDEVELNFLFNVGSVSGEIHLDNDNTDSTDGNQADIEQAHFTYSLDNGISFTIGRYGSKLGFEREDPAGLYSYSRAYSDATNYGDVDSLVREGVAINYAADAYTVGLSLDQTKGENLDDSGNGLNVELSLSYTGIENVNVGIGYRKEEAAGTNNGSDHLNLNASYQVGKALLAAEWQSMDPEATGSADQEAFMLLVDYDVSDKLGVAVRYSQEDQDTISTSALENSKWTIAPNFAITDSLGAIIEYSSTDVDVASGAASADEELFAVELTYTF